jgi:hypothetical protein
VIAKPKLTAAALTFIGGKPVSVLTLQVDPRDVSAIANGCEVFVDLGCHRDAAKQLTESQHQSDPPAAPEPSPAAEASEKTPRELAPDTLIVAHDDGRPVAAHE